MHQRQVKSVPFSTTWHINDKEPVYAQIVRQVKVQMATGRLQPGEPLPSRRELAILLSINPNTVQKAYHLLEEEGILSTGQSARSEVRAAPAVLERVRKELTDDMMSELIERSRELGLEFQDVIRLLTECWN